MESGLTQFAKAIDQCWLEGRFDDLAAYIAEDAVLVSPDGQHRIDGYDGFVGTYREFMARCIVRRFDTGNHVVTERGESAVVEYDWSMGWEDGDDVHSAKGHEILVLARRNDGWQVVWRMQLPG